MSARGLIAAAGRSVRMGEPKALVTLDGEPLVVRLARVFVDAGLAPVVVTAPRGDVFAAVVAAIGGLPVDVTENAHDDEGLFGSVRTARAGARDDDVVVVTPIDAPFATAALIRALVAAVDDAHDAAVPVFARMRGHPVAIRARALDAYSEIGRREGLFRVMAALGDRVADIPWDDERVVANLNTRDDLARASTTRRP